MTKILGIGGCGRNILNRLIDKRHAVGRKLLPKTPRWQEKEIQRLCKDERGMRKAPCRDDRKEES